MAIVSGDGMTVKLGKSGYENDILRVRRKCAWKKKGEGESEASN